MKFKVIKKWRSVLAGILCLTMLTGTAAFASESETLNRNDENYGTCYEVFVYSFYDSDGDGIGDLNGLKEKLDYINDGDDLTEEDLGCDMIWLMPIFQSPTYHKYDVMDYFSVDSQYGTMDDFDNLLTACKERGIRLILDLPVNHTSSQHSWFIQAAEYLAGLPEGQEPSAQECPYVEYYNFSREKQKDYEPLDGTDWYYEAHFWSGMPDLNLDNEKVREEIEEILCFWLERGIDGFRLDAVTSYYTDDKAKNIAFIAWLNGIVKAEKPDAYLVGEGWTDLDTYAQYYESGIDSMFNFAFAGQEGQPLSQPFGIPLLNGQRLAGHGPGQIGYGHAGAGVAVIYGNDSFHGRTKLAQALNLLMPGNAFLYYGEELGMKGSGKDENKRAPMYWSEDPEAEGMCVGPADMDEVKMKFGSLEEQSREEASVYAYVRKVIRLRNQYPAIMRGSCALLEEISGKEVCAIYRETEGEQPLLLVINTSKEPQVVDLAGTDCSCRTLKEMLCVSEETVEMEGTQLTLPPFDIAILGAE